MPYHKFSYGNCGTVLPIPIRVPMYIMVYSLLNRLKISQSVPYKYALTILTFESEPALQHLERYMARICQYFVAPNAINHASYRLPAVAVIPFCALIVFVPLYMVTPSVAAILTLLEPLST